MGRYKCAYNCENSGDSDVKHFKFPLFHPQKLKKWLVNMGWGDWTPTRFSVLCINHFEEKYIDRTGTCLKLKKDAVPTIFSSPGDAQEGKAPNTTRAKRQKPSGSKATPVTPAPSAANAPATARQSVPSREPVTDEHEGCVSIDRELKQPGRWRIVVDEGLVKIDSFPRFFHGDYCLPQHDIHWVPDETSSTECEDPDMLIEVTEPWQWLGLDVRGPLPQTQNGHRYILTVTDYFSKWVEAVPMQSCLNVAENLTDVIQHFGFPLRILSRLPHDVVHKINRELKEQLQVSVALVVHHHQTGSVDLITQHLLDRMVSDLLEEHAVDWDVYLPAKVFCLCFKEHPATSEVPFSLLCCKGLEPILEPRGLNYTYSKIRESTLVIR